MRYRRIGFHHDALALAVFDQIEGRVGNVAQHLVDHGLDLGNLPQAVNVLFQEVGYADGPELPGPQRVFQRTPRGAVALDIAVFGLIDLHPGLRAVYDHHIQIVKPHLPERLINGSGGGFAGLVLCRDL